MQVNITIEFNEDGTADIRVPEGPGQQRKAAKAAEFTEKLANTVGKIKERHVGDHHHGHDHQSTTNHLNT